MDIGVQHLGWYFTELGVIQPLSDPHSVVSDRLWMALQVALDSFLLLLLGLADHLTNFEILCSIFEVRVVVQEVIQDDGASLLHLLF